VLQTDLESAELAKLAINYFLNAQIETTNTLAAVAAKVGANWSDVAAVLRNDARIGPRAYLMPGHPNEHLLRDVNTIRKLRDASTGPASLTTQSDAERISA
jgi:UDPglucose 6-dehydrogenase